MPNEMRKRLREDAAFTLVELTVVTLIIAILFAIAVPSFIGFRDSADNRRAQTEVRTTLHAERAYWTDNQAYTQAEPDLQGYEPSLTIQNTGPATAGVYVDLNAANNEIVCISQTSVSGDTYSIWDNSTVGTYYGTTDLSAADCPAAAPAGYSNDGW